MSAKVKYYDLQDDMSIKGRWHLRSPRNKEGEAMYPWQFKEGKRLEFAEPVYFPVKPAGVELEFTLSSFTIPVLHPRVVSILERIGLESEVQFIPAHIEGQTDPYFILNALRIVRCIDDTRCEEALLWTPEDGEPDRVGQYKSVVGMKIDATKAGGVDIFRPWGWLVALIVSERVKQVMEDEDVIGPRFIEV